MTIEGQIQQHIIKLRIPQVEIQTAFNYVTKDELLDMLNSVSLSNKDDRIDPVGILRGMIRAKRKIVKTTRLLNEMQSQFNNTDQVDKDELAIIDLTVEYIEAEFELHHDDRIRAEQYRYLRNAYPSAIVRIPDDILVSMPTLQSGLTDIS